MNFTTLKLMLTALFGFALMGLSQITYAGWDSNACSGSGSAPCIEYQDSSGNWHHFNGSGGHAGNWHGNPSTGNDFDFCGTTELTCDDSTYTCELCLSGEVRKFQDSSNTWNIGVRVNSSTVSTGDWQCAFISPQSLPWFANDDDAHTYGPSSGIDYSGSQSTYTGSFGALDISVLGSNRVDQGHIHNVVYSNANSSFQFDGTLWEDGGTHTDSGCSVVSIDTNDLELQNGQDLNLN